MKLDQSSCYQVSVQTRPCTPFQTNYSRSLNKRRQVATVLLDDFAVARCDDVSSISSTRTDDVHTTRINAGTQPQSPTTAQTDDVDTNPSDAGTQLSSSTTPDDDVKTYQAAAENGDVSACRCGEDGSQPSTDLWNSLPEFEPRPAAAYRRRSSRMFFYDRLRSTHDCTDTEYSD